MSYIQMYFYLKLYFTILSLIILYSVFTTCIKVLKILKIHYIHNVLKKKKNNQQVFEAQPRRLFKRDNNMMVDQKPQQYCGNCDKMFFEIKCGGQYASKSNCGCAIICDCQDDMLIAP